MSKRQRRRRAQRRAAKNKRQGHSGGEQSGSKNPESDTSSESHESGTSSRSAEVGIPTECPECKTSSVNAEVQTLTESREGQVLSKNAGTQVPKTSNPASRIRFEEQEIIVLPEERAVTPVVHESLFDQTIGELSVDDGPADKTLRKLWKQWKLPGNKESEQAITASREQEAVLGDVVKSIRVTFRKAMCNSWSTVWIYFNLKCSKFIDTICQMDGLTDL